MKDFEPGTITRMINYGSSPNMRNCAEHLIAYFEEKLLVGNVTTYRGKLTIRLRRISKAFYLEVVKKMVRTTCKDRDFAVRERAIGQKRDEDFRTVYIYIREKPPKPPKRGRPIWQDEDLPF